MPEAAFYLWAQAPIDDDRVRAATVRRGERHRVADGSYVARDAHGVNPGQRRIRLALVANQAECAEAIARLVRVRTPPREDPRDGRRRLTAP